MLLTFGVGNAWGAEYKYTDFTTSFVKGTTNGTNISTNLSTSTNMSTISTSNSIFTGTPTTATNCCYSTSGAGLRISKSSGEGTLKFTLTDALKDSAIYAIVVYASKVYGNTKAKLDITPTGPTTGGYSTVTNIANGSLTAYNTSNPATTKLSTYKLDTIKVGGKKINTLQFASASGGYTMLHAITVVTQTEKSSGTSVTLSKAAASNGSINLTTNVPSSLHLSDKQLYFCLYQISHYVKDLSTRYLKY